MAAGAVLAYNAFAKGSAAKLLNFYPKSVDALKFKGLSPELDLSILIQNTSNQVMNLNSYAGKLYSNGYYIGNLSSYNRVQIPRNGEVVLKVKARLFLIGIVQDLIRSFNGNGFAQMVEIESSVNVDNYQIPVNLKYKIG